MTHDYSYRPSAGHDVDSIARIYAYYVKGSSTTFETDPPSAEEMAHRRLGVLAEGLPHLVVLRNDAVVGYAYASPYRTRPAYRFAVEDSIYIDPAHSRRGLGRMLLTALIHSCEAACRRQMIAVIGGTDNAASIGLHQALGFQHAGVLHAVGHKFGQWVDTVLMQRSLGEGDSTQPL